LLHFDLYRKELLRGTPREARKKKKSGKHRGNTIEKLTKEKNIYYMLSDDFSTSNPLCFLLICGGSADALLISTKG
jgi:hypothetical protein